MPKGVRQQWTAESLQRVMDASGRAEINALAAALDASPATIYSTKRRIEMYGGIQQFLDSMGGSGVYRRAYSVAEQLGRTYVIKDNLSGRNGASIQYTVTIPPCIGSAFIEKFGKAVKFVPTDDGFRVIPAMTDDVTLPDWMEAE